MTMKNMMSKMISKQNKANFKKIFDNVDLFNILFK